LQRKKVGFVRERNYHQVAADVRIDIEHDKIMLAAIEDKILFIVGGAGRVFSDRAKNTIR
jgi:hypothetical protein